MGCEGDGRGGGSWVVIVAGDDGGGGGGGDDDGGKIGSEEVEMAGGGVCRSGLVVPGDTMAADMERAQCSCSCAAAAVS